MNAPLFRIEAIAHRADRLAGDVAIAVPVGWHLISLLLGGSVMAALLFLSVASYARVETVSGVIVPDTGIASIVPSRSGVVSELSVRDGQKVGAGAPLATIRTEEDGAAGPSAAAKISSAIAQQDNSLTAQVDALAVAAAAQLSQLAAQRAGIIAEIGQLQAQIDLQQRLVGSASRDLERVRATAERGFISGRDFQTREETLLARQQVLSQLQQSLLSRRSAVVEAERSAAQITAQTRAQGASLAAARAQVAQSAASASGSRAYVLRAPVAGQVTALSARIGQPALLQQPLMSIVPQGSILRAELAVSSAAIGFVKPRQAVRLAIDSFPYQRFGTISGRVLTVAASPISQRGANGSVVSVYPVVIALGSTRVTAFGRDEPLVPGMTLTARVVTENQTLLQWLFEPLYAVRRR